MSQLDATTDSGDSPGPDIVPSKFPNGDLDVSGVPAVVTWIDHDAGRETEQRAHHSVSDLSLQFHRDTSSNSAFLQLKANVSLKARRDRTNIFVSIPPECVRTVAVVEDEGTQSATDKLATSTHSLRLDLSSPPSLVVPKGDLTPKNKNSGAVLDSLQALAKQTCFSVHIPCATLAKLRLVSFCEAVSSSGVRSSPKFLDVASLYGGKGARVIEYDPEKLVAPSYAPTASEPKSQSPPSYDELSLSSPPRPSIIQSKSQTAAAFSPRNSADLHVQSLDINVGEPALVLILTKPLGHGSPYLRVLRPCAGRYWNASTMASPR